MASVSRQLRGMCQRIVKRMGRLDITRTDKPCQLGSAFLQTCAPLLRTLALEDGACSIPGAVAFAGAAANIDYLLVNCDSSLSAAEATYLLPGCPAMCDVSLCGSFQPAAFPPFMCSLEVEFPEVDANPDTLIYSMARHREVASLHLYFNSLRVSLTCPVVLPQPLSIEVFFELAEGSDLDCSWLHRQPCDELNMRVSVSTANPACHTKVIQQLQQLPVAGLTLFWAAALPRQLQSLWAQLSILKEFTLDLRGPPCFTSAAEALHALPSCPTISIETRFRVLAEPLFMTWSAVAGQAGRVLLRLGLQSLRVIRQQGLPEGPWQLQVAAKSVYGLRGARQSEAVLLMQNGAADAAGWTVNHLL